MGWNPRGWFPNNPKGKPWFMGWFPPVLLRELVYELLHLFRRSNRLGLEERSMEFILRPERVPPFVLQERFVSLVLHRRTASFILEDECQT